MLLRIWKDFAISRFERVRSYLSYQGQRLRNFYTDIFCNIDSRLKQLNFMNSHTRDALKLPHRLISWVLMFVKAPIVNQFDTWMKFVSKIFFTCLPEVYSEPSKRSKMELFTKTANSWKPLAVFAKTSYLLVWEGSEYASHGVIQHKCFLGNSACS